MPDGEEGISVSPLKGKGRIMGRAGGRMFQAEGAVHAEV